MMMRLRAALCLGAALSLGVAGDAWSSGGGGGGGGEMPSASAPTYDPAAEYAKAIAALNQQDFKTAARALGHVTEAAPDNPEAWRLLGVAKAGSQDLKGAPRAYDKAVRYAPENIDGHKGLGVALGGLKDPKAQGELAEALRRDAPDTATSLARWAAESRRLQTAMARREPRSLFNPRRLAAATDGRLPRRPS